MLSFVFSLTWPVFRRKASKRRSRGDKLAPAVCRHQSQESVLLMFSLRADEVRPSRINALPLAVRGGRPKGAPSGTNAKATLKPDTSKKRPNSQRPGMRAIIQREITIHRRCQLYHSIVSLFCLSLAVDDRMTTTIDRRLSCSNQRRDSP